MYCLFLVFNQDEIQTRFKELNDKLESCDELVPIKFLYHCKDSSKWTEINGEFKPPMKKTMRAKAGHPANTLSFNGDLTGYWFSTTPDKNGLPDQSPYGNVRYRKEVNKLLNVEAMNFYYEDHWCASNAHYITILVTNQGTEKDELV